MTSLFVTIVAIVLFSIVSLLAITYIDTDSARAATQSPIIAQAVMNLSETVSTYREITDGSNPPSLAAMAGTVEIPALPNIDGASWEIDGGRLCMSLPTTPANKDLLDAAAFRLGSDKGLATVSTACGTLNYAGRTAVHIAI